jgi:hypothetical protein
MVIQVLPRNRVLIAAIGMLAGTITCSIAIAQPLLVPVKPSPAGSIILAGHSTGPVQSLFESGPRYSAANGRRRVSVGSEAPNWMRIGVFQNVSVPGLRPTSSYAYVISSDGKAVVLDPDTHRVVRVINRP